MSDMLTSKGAETRSRILDAAESLFAERGYFGTTIRDVTAALNLKSGLIRYYFTSKDDLFREVFDRRARQAADAQTLALDETEHRMGPELDAQAVLQAFIAPSLLHFARGEAHWINFYKLVTQRLYLQDDAHLMSAIELYMPPVRTRYIHTLRKVCPLRSAREVRQIFDIFEAAFGALFWNFNDPDIAAEKRPTRKNLAEIRKLPAYFALILSQGRDTGKRRTSHRQRPVRSDL